MALKPSHRILISGAGLSALSFTVALHKLWPTSFSSPPPQITIFERETVLSAASREGYTLSLAGNETNTGLVAMHDLDLLEEILASKNVVGKDNEAAFKVWNGNWSEMMGIKLSGTKGIPVGGVRVARKELRRVLLEKVQTLQGVEIRWGEMCVSAEEKETKTGSMEESGNGKVKITVCDSDGRGERVEEGDLLIVADGASSKIRGILRPEDTLDYAGAILLAGVAEFPEGVPAPVDKNWGLQVSGQGVCCFYAPTDAQHVLWALSFLEPTPRPKQSSVSQREMDAILDEAREKGEVLGPLFRRIVDASNDPSTVSCLPALDKKPFRHEGGNSRVVFIGDSNHAVSPFAGFGANLALKDGWDLAKCLVDLSSVKDAVQKYDDLSYSRAVKVLNSSRWRITNGHSTGVRFWLFSTFVSFGGFILRVLGKS